MAKCIIILGMHRSATSLIAKGLVAAGVNMGTNYLRHDHANPEGYYEDMDFLKLNKRLLRVAGGDWENIPSEKEILSIREKRPEIIQRLKSLVEKKQKRDKLWGWKDPRTILTIKLYEPFLKEQIYVTCHRNPHDIAKSLNLQHQIPIEKGILIANEYNRRLTNFL